MANTQTSVPVFTAGQILTAQQQTEINTGIPVFATAVTRDAAFGGAGEKVLAEGQACYIEDSNRLQINDGSAFRSFDVGFNSYTPSVTAGSGTFTTVSATGKFVVILKTVLIYFKIIITTNGTAGGSVVLTTPINISSDSGASVGSARELAVNGSMNNVVGNSATTVSVLTTTNGYPGGTGFQLAGFAVVEVA